jgi:hypothetical protein
VEFTFRWTQADRWEDTNYQVIVADRVRIGSAPDGVVQVGEGQKQFRKK